MGDLAHTNDQGSPKRRIFLKQVATIVGAAPLTLGTSGTAGAETNVTANAPAPNTSPTAHAWRFFNGTEARAVEAAVARLIPADEVGPGAKEAGVAVFIDLQLVSAWGNGDHFYRQAPFVTGTPQQGYQLAFTPAEMFRLGLAKLDESARKAYGAAFADLSIEQQDALLAQAHQGKLDFGTLPSGVSSTRCSTRRWKDFSAIRSTAATATRSVGSS